MAIIEDIEQTNLTSFEKEAIADELIKPYPNVYTTKQLRRKEREMQTRLESRTIIEKYVSEEFTELDNTLIESFLGDIKDAANRGNISDTDYDLICMRARKMSYTAISAATGLPKSTCFERLQIAQEKILEVECFGKWEERLKMESHIQSNWYLIFKNLIRGAEYSNR